MDFEALLSIAQKNERNKKEPIKCLQTKFKPPSKEQREKDRVLSEGVQKFLARKEEEDRRKKKDDNRKMEELLALRALDPKANRRIQHMLKRTKSANKSVMDDVDTTNTADTIGGIHPQPDEDDYGFVSGEASALYDKLVKKVYGMPSDNEVKFAPSKKPKGGNLSNTKERVKMALMKQEEEENGPRKRKRRKKEGGEEDNDDITFTRPHDDDKRDSDKSDKPKVKRPPGPPPMDFMELLKLAEKKQHEPVVIEPKVKKEPEPDQLMTKKQRLEHEKMLEFKRQREIRLKERERISNGKPATMMRIPKIGQTSSEQRNDNQKNTGGKSESSQSSSKTSKISSHSEKGNASSSSNSERLKPSSSTSAERVKTSMKIPKIVEKSSVPKVGSGERVSKKSVESETEKLKRERDEVLRLLKEKEEAVRILEEKERLIRERDEAVAKLKRLQEQESKIKTKPVPAVSKPNQPRASSSEVSKPSASRDVPSKVPARSLPPKDVKPAVREFPPKDVRKLQPAVREFPPKDVRKAQVSVREFPPRDVRGVTGSSGRPLTKEQKIQLLKKRLAEQKRRRIDDSEDEYDSELDDFIDDGPDPSMEREAVSKAISEIFKYDKNKYSRFDDDTECMESNFAQISKEEYYSAKCGLLEDLEDIRAEKQELARKKAKSKKK